MLFKGLINCITNNNEHTASLEFETYLGEQINNTLFTKFEKTF